MLTLRRLLHRGVDSQIELETLATTIGATPGRRDRFSYFLMALHTLCRQGAEVGQGQWIKTHRNAVKVYTGETMEPIEGRVRIWAAIEVAPQRGIVTLLLTSDGYTGRDHWARLAQAVDRLDHGKIEDWR